jgi:hypothetical protein
MGKFLAVKGANINILLNVILLAVNQVNMRLKLGGVTSALHKAFRWSKRKITNKRSILYLTNFRNNTSLQTTFSKICPINLTSKIKA